MFEGTLSENAMGIKKTSCKTSAQVTSIMVEI
jgi:hypothetical protein